MDRGTAQSALAAENARLREKNEADAKKLRKLEALLANIGRDMSRLCLPFDQVQRRQQRQAERNIKQLEAQHVKLRQQNRDLLAAAQKGARLESMPAEAGEGSRHRHAAAMTCSDEERLSEPATLRMLDFLLEKEDAVAALRNDVARLQSSLHHLDPDRLSVSMSALA